MKFSNAIKKMNDIEIKLKSLYAIAQADHIHQQQKHPYPKYPYQ